MKRKLAKDLMTPNELFELYITQNLSTLEIGKIHNCHPNTIRRLLKKYDIQKSKETTYKRMLENRTKTFQKRYGVNNNSQLDSWKQKVKQTCQKKYGVNCVSQIEEVKTKIKETCCKNYGVSNPMKVKEFERKGKETCLKNNGFISPFEKDEIKQKCIKTWLEKYGVDNPSKAPEIIQKKIDTWNMKYGKGTKGFQELQDKLKDTCMQKYGVPYNCLRKECKEASSTISKINIYWKNLLESLDLKVTMEYTIGSKTYDLKLENSKYLLEIDPTPTHNSYVNIFTKTHEGAKDKSYHYQKSKLATDNNHHCIHVWSWDNKNKILSLFKKKDKLYARDTEIKQISTKEANEFNNLYHLQNTCKGQAVIYGLYYKDQLLSLMSFGKPRYNKNYQWELLRYTTHPEYMVLGGAEKLFKHFVSDYNPDNVLTYCDYSKFSGQVYNKLGFELLKHTQPSCHWSFGSQHITQAQLSKYGFDKLLGNIYGCYGKGTNNQELMLQHGYLPVYDCGQLVFKWVN